MGEIEILHEERKIVIHSDFIFYGNHASPDHCAIITDEISEMWNSTDAKVLIQGNPYKVYFQISGTVRQDITRAEIEHSTSLRNNYIRIEEFSKLEVSFVDRILSNTGYFILHNMEKDSTTSAHEYGHMLGLEHPSILDIRGKGRPSIMYPRGTLVDSEFQWNPTAPAGAPGGTMNPYHRTVSILDILDIRIPSIILSGKKYIGAHTNTFHEAFIPKPL
jgi:hypothetical protein